MLIRREILERIRSGEITVQFRRWTRRTVRPGGTLKTAVGVLSIGEIRRIDADDVSDGEARLAGFPGREAFLAWLDTMKPGELDRIEVGFLGDDPREALRLDADLDDDALAAIVRGVEAAGDSDWSWTLLDLVAAGPGVPAEAHAAALGRPKPVVKARARRLKELGLIESLSVGYRISPRGSRVRAYRGAG